jgi:cation diffusion facilitator CzcD-associated flavoprotein CzcO
LFGDKQILWRRWCMTIERLDVIIVGAGLSGIGAAR